MINSDSIRLKKIMYNLYKLKKIFLISCFDFLILLFVYGSFLNFTFSSDNIYSFMEIGTKNLGVIDYCYGGRYTIYFFCKLLDFFNFDYFHGQIYSQLFKIFCTEIVVLIATKAFSEVINKEGTGLKLIIINCCVLFAAINVFYVETFIYVTPDWGIGILLAGLTFWAFINKRYILSGVLAFLTVSEYQVFLIVSGILILTFLYLKNKSSFTFYTIKEYSILMIIMFLAAGLNLLLPHILNILGILSNPTRQVSFTQKIDLKFRLRQIFEIFKWILRDSLGMMPNKIIFYFIILLVSFYIVVLLFKKKIVELILFSLHVCVIFFAPFALGLITAGFYMPARVLFPFYYSITALSIIVFSEFTNKYTIFIFGGLIVIFLSVSVWNTKKSSDDHYVSNILDQQYAREIQEKINQYEEETDNKIKIIKIQEWSKREKTWDYREFMKHEYYDTNYNLKLFYDDWAVVPIIEFVSGRKYEMEYMTDNEYKEFFGGKSWGYINLELQVEFINDTAYLAIY